MLENRGERYEHDEDCEWLLMREREREFRDVLGGDGGFVFLSFLPARLSAHRVAGGSSHP